MHTPLHEKTFRLVINWLDAPPCCSSSTSSRATTTGSCSCTRATSRSANFSAGLLQRSPGDRFYHLEKRGSVFGYF